MSVISSTPVYKLNSDILLDIFAINGNIFTNERRALHNTRVASQVCRQWRTLMLNTPFLWARLLDSEELKYIPGYEWWNELLRRSEDAPLWIRVRSFFFNHNKQSTMLKQFFVDVIHGNWYRIQRLFIDDDYSGAFVVSPAMFCFPAPQLEEFHTSIPRRMTDTADHNEEAGIGPIFAGHAPMPRKFCYRGLILDQRASWVRNLHFIEIDSRYGVHSTLTVLSATRHLQHLEIHDIMVGDIHTPLPFVSLPDLKSFHCFAFPNLCVALLDHMDIPLGCPLTLEISHCFVEDLKDLVKALLVAVFKLFICYMERYLKSRLFNIIHFNYLPDRLSVECRTTFPDTCLLRISLPVYNMFDMTQTELIFNVFASLDLTQITSFNLRAHGICFDPFIRPILDNIHHLETIHIDSDTLSSLMSLEKRKRTSRKSAIFFPFLKIIVGVISSRYRISKEIAVFVKFILSRAQNGYCITTLDMSRTMPLETSDLVALKGVNVLKVRYKRSQMNGIFEYSCGSDEL